MRFATIDFETANHDRASACAVGLVLVEGDRIVDRVYELIRPLTREFVFTHIHGLTWSDVRSAPTFADLCPALKLKIQSVEFLAAHNAPFDRSVLTSCCRSHGLVEPRAPFVCTVRVARAVWNIYRTKLPDVCRQLSIPLTHHRADADAEACARIVFSAAHAGWKP